MRFGTVRCVGTRTQTQVGRSTFGYDLVQHRRHLIRKSRDVGIHILQTAQAGQIFDGVVGTSHNTVTIATPVTNQKNRHVMQAHVITKLFQTPIYHEWRDAVAKHFIPFISHTSRHTNHVLLGHARIDETRPQRINYVFQCIVAQVTSDEYYFIVFPPDFLDGSCKFLSHIV